MTNWPVIGIVAGAEIAVFFGATVRSFSAKGRLDRERDNDIRAAIAGYETGQIIPALVDLVESVIAVRGSGESTADALSRADTDAALNAAVDASVKSRSPRAWEQKLVSRYTALGISLVVCHIAAPVSLYNVLTDGYSLPQTAVIVAGVIFVVGAIIALWLGALAAVGEATLAGVIREGKDAAPRV
jgi:hypothetical protein